MAPIKGPKNPLGADNQKPTVLATVAKAKRVLPKYSHAQRSSLRLALQESLRDSAAGDETTQPSSPIASQSLSSSPTPSASPSSASITPRRRSMRQALKGNLHVNTSIATEIIHPATPSPTPSLSSSSSPSAPSTVANTPRTPVTPFSTSPLSATFASPFATPSKGSRKPVPHEAKVVQDDSDYDSDHADDDVPSDCDSDSDYVDKAEARQYARVDDTDRPDVNGIATPFKGWYRIRSIVTEMRNRSGGLIYLVDWEGTDPRTGVSWPSSWVESKNVSVAAIRAWENLKLRHPEKMA
ncbi:uncharacterized protein F4807DRAFT_471645 [Annulohypoxylon truncatum]|uniref:uncharacterized protein n=1 Tax=Annulohypoxylon truncatum TaxID=327061 RepID=UPI002007D839|nr:uncharacterized protein F4807DRAFT_471645 [Annulohypoxylon truncatum]KAI1213201.1 hypothetical protein F4807DRAFT_471645 [Annulohypoxylon truncatum]